MNTEVLHGVGIFLVVVNTFNLGSMIWLKTQGVEFDTLKWGVSALSLLCFCIGIMDILT